MKTKEENALKVRLYRIKYADKLHSWERSYYRRVKSEKNRIKAFQGRICRCCEILLSDEYGGRGTKYYCRDCVNRGSAKKHYQREATRRWRLKNKLLIRG